MLPCEAPHTGTTVEEVLVKKLTKEASSVRERRGAVPVHVDAALAKVLARLPADRFRTAEEFRTGLTDPSWAQAVGWVAEGATDASAVTWRRRFVIAAAVAIVAALSAVTAYLRPGTGPAAADGAVVRRWSVQLPDSAPLAFVGSGPLGVGHTALDISRDGSVIAFIGQETHTTRLYVRPVGALDATPVAGTEGAYDPFFSPDGTWIAFFADDALKKVALTGGAPVTLARAPNPSGGTWTEDGWIAFGVEEGQRLLWIPETGGATEERYASEAGLSLEWGGPRVTPGGSALVYASYGRVRGLLLEIGERRDILAGTAPRSAGSGHLLHQWGGQLLASAFDPERLQAIGPPVPVLDGLRIEGSGATQYALSSNGTLVYAPGSWALIGRLAWVAPDEGLEYLPFDAALYGRFDRSPDGRRLALSVGAVASNIWVLDLETALATSVTSDDRSLFPLWTPDGRSLAFHRYRDTRVFRKLVDSGEPAERLAEAGVNVIPTSWSADGRTLLVDVFEEASWSIYQINADVGSPGEPFVSTDSNEWGAVFGPGDKWFAYTTDEPGRFEVFVEPYPRTGQRWQVSTDGGEEPTWGPDGSMLYYRSGTRLMSVSIAPGPAFRSGVPEVFVQEDRWLNIGGRSYLVSPDGARALMILGPEERTSSRLNVVENWFEELNRLAPGGR
jgi:serine/threonine-protein kinase